MNILLLGNKGLLLKEIIENLGHTCRLEEGKLQEPITEDFIISFGYRYMVHEDIVKKFENKIINMHISYLPWNRGADPNLWSILENTPKGVTIHRLTDKLDCGDILLQKEVCFSDTDTLKTSYDKLINEIVGLFAENIDDILLNKINSYPQQGAGSFHKTIDKEKYSYLFNKLLWDTPIRELEGKAL